MVQVLKQGQSSITMKCTLAITMDCNLSCDYCYINKHSSIMDLSTAEKIIDFIFENALEEERTEIGFFGGEPLLEFDLIRAITGFIQSHPSFDPDQVTISVTSNGTIYSREIEEFLLLNKIVFCVSCDGPPIIQNKYRHFPDGSGSSAIVEKNIKQALGVFPLIPVNAVYSPENVSSLPFVLDYLCDLGISNIYLNPNISASWTQKHVGVLKSIFDIIGQKYLDYYLKKEPKFINLIDSKITVIFRGGYQPNERCRIGKGEFAFAPSGNIYPCEKLIGSDDGVTHCLGNINNNSYINEQCHLCNIKSGEAINIECQTCLLRDYCIHWCTCMNYYGTGKYNLVSPFICASEKAALKLASQIIKDIGNDHLFYLNHVAGTPLLETMDRPRI